jgi:hypothetical protein
MLQRIRLALQGDKARRPSGEMGVDSTFVDGKGA